MERVPCDQLHVKIMVRVNCVGEGERHSKTFWRVQKQDVVFLGFRKYFGKAKQQMHERACQRQIRLIQPMADSDRYRTAY